MNMLLSSIKFSDFQCGKCDESFEIGLDLHHHLRTHISKSFRDILQPKYFECFICKKHKTKTMTAMRKHMKKHSMRNYSKCEICNIRSESASHLCGKKEHVQCEYCSKQFQTTKQMQKHLDDVHKNNQRLYRCAKCPKFFAMVFFKDCHEALHLEKQELQCDMCPKKFATNEYLSNHRKRHTDLQKCKNYFRNSFFPFVVLFLLNFISSSSQQQHQNFCVKNAERNFLRLKI